MISIRNWCLSPFSVSAIAGGVGGGLGFTSLGEIGGWQVAVVRGATSSVITQGISLATGLQRKFDWTGVAVSAVVGGVAKSAGKWAEDNLHLSNWQTEAFSNTLGAFAGAATRSAIDGTDFGDALEAALPSAVAATIGFAVADRLTQTSLSRGQTLYADDARAAAERRAGPGAYYEGGPGGGYSDAAGQRTWWQKGLDWLGDLTGFDNGSFNVSNVGLNRHNTDLLVDTIVVNGQQTVAGATRGFLDVYGTLQQSISGFQQGYAMAPGGGMSVMYAPTVNLGIQARQLGSDLNSGYNEFARFMRGTTYEDRVAVSGVSGINSAGGAYQGTRAQYEAEVARVRGFAQQSSVNGAVAGVTFVRDSTPIVGELVLLKEFANNPGWVTGSVAAVGVVSPFAGRALGRAIGGAESVGARGFSGAYATNGELVQSIATRADNWGIRQGLGNGPVAGTLKHGYAESLLNRYQRMFGDRGLTAEARYVGGSPWEPGMPTTGSIRLDVVEGPLTNPTYVWDYKFGNAILSQSRITQIQNGIPNGANVPILMVKP